MNTLEANGISIPTDTDYFRRAAEDFVAAVHAIHTLMAREQEGRAGLAKLKREREQLEAGWFRDNLVAGSNAEARGHALVCLRAESREWDDLTLQIEVGESGLAMVQRDLERERDLRALAKRRMDAHIAARLFFANSENG